MKTRRTAWILLASILVATGCQLFTPSVETPTPASPTTVSTTAPGQPTSAFTAAPQNTPRPTTPPPDTQAIASCVPEQSLNPNQEGLGDPYFPGLGNGGYDALHYTLDINVDLDRNLLRATATVDARARKALREFNLDFRGFGIEQVTVGDQPAQYSRSGVELTITPIAPIEEGQEFTVTVQYSGIPQNSVEQGMRLGWNRYENGIYVASEPSGASSWYPVNDHPCDKASYTFHITVPEPYVVAANGVLTGTSDNGETTTYTWEESHPMASYLATVNIARFVYQEQQGPNGMVVRNYFDQSIADQVEPVFRRQPDMIEFFNSIYGPYPFDEYGVVVVDANFGFALETQTLSLFSSRGLSRADRENEQVVAHELAHQWFGNSVTLDNWKDIWLNEGFATYSQWLWVEHDHGRAAMESQIKGWYDTLARNDHPPVGDPSNRDLFNMSVYFRGGLTLHALRLRLGDDVFFDLLRAYADQYKYGNASTDDFIALAEEHSGQSLDDFFQAWLYAEKMPPRSEITR